MSRLWNWDRANQEIRATDKELCETGVSCAGCFMNETGVVSKTAAKVRTLSNRPHQTGRVPCRG